MPLITYLKWVLVAATVVAAVLLVGTHSREAEAHTYPLALKIGDVNCSGDITSVDELMVLRYVAGLSYSHTEPCPSIAEGHLYQNNGGSHQEYCCGVWADVDCDWDVDSVDALKIGRYVAGFNDPSCQHSGTTVIHDVGDYPRHYQTNEAVLVICGYSNPGYVCH